jgi:type I restriction enzyme, S subunit
MNKWKEYKLSEVYEFSSGLSKGAAEFGFGFDFLSFKEIFKNYFVPDTLTNLVNSTTKEQESCSIKRGDVFLTRTSETDDDLGISSVALKDYPKATFNGFTKRLRPKNNVEIIPEFAGFYFRSPRFRATVTSMSSMTTRASLNNGMLAQLAITVPPVLEQKAISDLLISLVKKIDLLQRQNQTLEALAETVFRQWFIEEKNNVTELGNIAIITTGKGLKQNEFIENGEYAVLGANGIIGKTNKYYTDEKLILTGRVGTLGKIHINNSKVWISDNVLIMKPIDLKYFYPIYFSLKRIDFENMNVGSTQPLVTQTDLKKVEIELLEDEKLLTFQNLCEDFFDKIKSNTTQIKTLTNLRDTLLPKLMSGEVTITN